jgi:hypothetical protein
MEKWVEDGWAGPIRPGRSDRGLRKQIIKTFKLFIMSKENFDFLNRTIKFLGFGEDTMLNQLLEAEMVKEQPEFDLYTDAFFDHYIRTEAKLNFVLLDQKGIYILHHYTATSHYEQDPTKDKTREFHIFKGTGVTFKEAFNLLDGRAARIDQRNRDEELYRVWVQLDFEERDTHQNYKYKYYRYFDLDKVLDKYPIAEMEAEATRKMVIASLERGNKHLITLNTAKPEPKWIEANPAERTIRIYAPVPSPATPARRSSELRRPGTRRVSKGVNDPSAEKAAEDQELSEETALASRK